MKPHSLLSFGAVFAALTLNPWIATAQLGNDSVRIEVQLKSDQDRKEVQNTQVDTVTQTKTLEITVRGKAKTPETRTGKWKVFGRGLKDHKVVLLESGDFPVALTENGQQKVTSKTVTV